MGLADFQLVGRLGAGNFAEVVQVKRQQDGRYYALKRVNLAELRESDLKRVVNEIRILASFRRHPRIVRCYETFIEYSGASGPELFIVMEYCPNGDLGQLIKRHRSQLRYIDEGRIWSYAIQLMEGLVALHALGVIHRDLKPANCLLDASGGVKICDMNIAKICNSSAGKLNQTRIGTPLFMSPEAFLSRPYDVKTDLWSLGCIVYYLSALVPPFNASNLEDLGKILMKATYENIPNHFSVGLATLVSWLLKVDPKSRPHAQELLQSPLVLAQRESLHQPPLSLADQPGDNNDLAASLNLRLGDTGGIRSVTLPGPAYDQVDTPAPQFIQSRRLQPQTSFPDRLDGPKAALPPVRPTSIYAAALRPVSTLAQRVGLFRIWDPSSGLHRRHSEPAPESAKARPALRQSASDPPAVKQGQAALKTPFPPVERKPPAGTADTIAIDAEGGGPGGGPPGHS